MPYNVSLEQIKDTDELDKDIFYDDEENQDTSDYIDIVYCYRAERNSFDNSRYGELRITGLYK